jgi:hypothetical protein
MAARGRKSAASVGIVKQETTKESRLLPPLHMTDAERSVWVSLVNDQPANSFTQTHAPLIEIYCRHVVNSRILADEIINFNRAWLADDEGLKRYDKLLAMSEREGRAASSLATRLRITRQAVDQQTIARALVNSPKTQKPWEIEFSADE